MIGWGYVLAMILMAFGVGLGLGISGVYQMMRRDVLKIMIHFEEEQGNREPNSDGYIYMEGLLYGCRLMKKAIEGKGVKI